ncbi:hypothetical protein [Streptomyces ureilyticus]|uniref:SMODS-associated and fused to various effectors domain-containing protein n=1 Tax=Streptomyces ureilyticus TaxID=1775131 RepID=A0ABX0DMY5_9ACTN|nr:hypothetical protein [Streptomyces ureilyticus]NGO43242.1 hypothetical protein [Streptomyces ureilyticus]
MKSSAAPALQDTPRHALYALFGAWLSMTVVRQFQSPWARKLCQRVDPTGAALPISTFFAPRPGNTDTHLLVRDKLADGTVTEWAEYQLIEKRTLRHMVWHSGRRSEKAMFDVLNQLRQILATEQRIEYLQLTVPYLIVLNFVTHHCPHDPATEKTQFLLVTSTGYDQDDDPRGFLTSAFHDLR